MQQWVSLDGYASGPSGEDEIFRAVPEAADAASQRWNETLLDDVEVVLLGRKTYTAFARYWPESDEPIAARVNSIAKVVCSRSLDAAAWGAFTPARIEREAVPYLRSIRGAFTGHVLIWGSLSIVHELLEAGELDELDLFVAPVALGAGTPLLRSSVTRLRQLHVEAFPGAVHVRYAIT